MSRLHVISVIGAPAYARPPSPPSPRAAGANHQNYMTPTHQPGGDPWGASGIVAVADRASRIRREIKNERQTSRVRTAPVPDVLPAVQAVPDLAAGARTQSRPRRTRRPLVTLPRAGRLVACRRCPHAACERMTPQVPAAGCASVERASCLPTRPGAGTNGCCARGDRVVRVLCDAVSAAAKMSTSRLAPAAGHGARQGAFLMPAFGGAPWMGTLKPRSVRGKGLFFRRPRTHLTGQRQKASE